MAADTARLINTVARGEAIRHGFEPLELYPGSDVKPWQGRCTTCQQPRTSRLADIRRDWWCQHQGTRLYQPPGQAPGRPVLPPLTHVRATTADAELRLAGYEPLTLYPGAANRPWTATCTGCGRVRRPSLSKIRQGRRCQHDRKSYPTAPAADTP